MTEKGKTLDIRTFRESRPKQNTRFAFCQWINEKLQEDHLSLSISYLRDLESGRSIPSLALAIAIEDITSKTVRVRDWAGLSTRKQRQASAG
jgi:hypothetical protein